LDIDSAEVITKWIVPRVVRDVRALQIVRDENIEFMAGDNFHRECVSVGPAVPETVLRDLIEAGIIRGYKRHAPPV
jgi:hypothetical protein